MADKLEMDAVVEAGRRSTAAKNRINAFQIDNIDLVYVADLNGRVQLDKDALAYIAQQKPYAVRPKERIEFHDADSLCAYVGRFSTSDATLWCNVAEPAIVVVLDDHFKEADEALEGRITAGHRQWRAIHKPEHSYSWKAWSRVLSTSHIQQETLADQLEENIQDVCKVDDLPSGIELLNLAKSLEIYSKGTFKKEINPQTGEHMLVCQEEHAQGSTRIPHEFNLRIPVFEGDAAYDVRVRLTFRLVDGKPRFTLKVPRMGEIVTDALRKLGERVAKTLSMQLYMGDPG